MPVSYGCHTDYHPGTVIRIISEKTIDVQSDNWKIASGSEWDGTAEYDYTRNSGGLVMRFRATKKGWNWKGYRLTLGLRRRYYDPSF
jgi:hypothetical protein